jgi:hypothetical protein
MADPNSSLIGQRNLGILLKTMAPVLQDEEYVFCSIPEGELAVLQRSPLGMFQEMEGVTVIVTAEQARQANLSAEPRWRLITLSVHSDLQAVGFLAAVTASLAAAEISVNAVSAYFHDHLFVPSQQAEAAMACLMELAELAD